MTTEFKPEIILHLKPFPGTIAVGVSQVVDIRKGVHCMIPKSIFTKQ